MKTRILVLSCAALLVAAGPAAAGFTVVADDGEMSFDATLRVLMTEQEGLPGGGDDDDLVTRNARFGIRGTYLQDLSWRMEWEMRAHDDDNDLIGKDLWFRWSSGARFLLTAGQMKVPLGRRQLVSTKRLDTIKLPEAAGDFLPRRDVGLLAALRTGDGSTTLSAGVFQGAGDNASGDDAKHKKMLAGRIETMPWGEVPRGEGDPLHSETPKALLAIAAVRSDDAPGLTADNGAALRAIDGRKTLYGADVSFWWRGFFLAAEYARACMEWDADAALHAGRTYDATGLVLQANYTIPGLNLQPRVMYDSFDPDDEAAGDARKTLTWGVNWLPHGHDFKIMAEYVDRLEMNDLVCDDWEESEYRLLAQIWVH